MRPFPFFLILATSLMVIFSSSCADDPIDPNTSCYDGIQNGNETGIDCGGDCKPCPTCDDDKKNGEEEGVDCGGPDCPPCAINIDWSTYTEWPNPRVHMAAAMHDDKIYISGGGHSLFGGVDKVAAFNPADRTWETKAQLNVARTMHAMEVVGGKLYVMGGVAANETWAYPSMEKYDPLLDQWVLLDEYMNPARVLFGSCVLDGKIYVIGGKTGLNIEVEEILKSAQVYNPESGTWDTLPSLIAPRYGLEVEVWDGKIYAIGGGTSSFIPPIEVYDPKHPEKGWVPKTYLRIPRGGFSTCELNGMIYCFGGLKEDKIFPSNWGMSSVEVYAPILDRSFIATSTSLGRIGPVSFVWQDQILVFGGVKFAWNSGPCVSEVECGVVQQ